MPITIAFFGFELNESACDISADRGVGRVIEVPSSAGPHTELFSPEGTVMRHVDISGIRLQFG